MALPLGVAILVLAYVHDEAGDGADRGARAGARTRLVLGLLVVGFPAPSQFQARLLAMPGQGNQGFHGVLVHMALEGKAAFGREQAGNRAQRYRLGEERAFMEPAQEQNTPTTRKR